MEEGLKKPTPEELHAHLDKLRDKAVEDPNCLYCATDASVPAEKRHQAVSVALVFRGGQLVYNTRFAARAAIAQWF